MIILPDSWILPTGCTFISGFTPSYGADSGSGWSRNNYTLTQWAQMERAGAVFLPAAGARWGIDVVEVGVCGYYWSSSYCDEDWAYYLDFYGYDQARTTDYHRYGGFSVRPVLDNN